MTSPAVVQIYDLRAHWLNGALGVAFPNGCPPVVLTAISALNSGWEHGKSEQLKDKHNEPG